MYAPPAFAEDRPEVLCAAMVRIRLGTLVSATQAGLMVSHLPLFIQRDGDAVRLEGHLARANPHWQAIGAGCASVAIFQGPHAYVRPGWYPSKAETGKVVPTWAYIAVHAHGALTATLDADWLLRHLHAITDAQEAGRDAPWSVDDAPPDYIAARMRGIVGVSLSVSQLMGSWKLNQNKSEADQAGTAAGLTAAGPDGAALAAAMTAPR